MKRNFDLVREILLAAEAQDFQQSKPIAPKGYTNEEIKYHIKIMEDGGLIRLRQHPGIDLPAPVFDGLTWEGHEFLDSIREQTTWNKVKLIIQEKSLGLSYESVKVAVIHVIKSAIGS